MENSTQLIKAEQESLELRAQLQALQITDQTSYDIAVERRVAAKAWLKQAASIFDPIVKKAHEAWKAAGETRKKILEPTENAVRQIDAALLKWDREQEALRQAEQRRLAEEARRQAEEERLQTAANLEAAGVSNAVVEQVLDAPIVAAPVVAPPTYERSKAVTYRDNWSGEVTDLTALVVFVAANPQHINLLQVNQTALNQLAKAMKESLSFPGVQAVNNRVAVSGRG